jgi:uncharacterized protein (TIGR03437 family)
MQFSNSRQIVCFSFVLSLALFIVLGVAFSYSARRLPQSLQAATTARAQLHTAYGKLPLSFEANAGQADPSVKFLARNASGGVYLTAHEAILALPNCDSASKVQPTLLRLKLHNANAAPQLTGENELPGKSHYLLGKDQSRWQRNIANYARVRYHSVYPGIDLVYYGNQQRLEYDFVIAPGADPRAIKVGFAGATRVTLDANGDLLVPTVAGELRQSKPLIYQESRGERRIIAGGYKLIGESDVTFEVGAYDRGLPLVIDPVLNYQARTVPGVSVAVDAQGNAYITAIAYSNAFTGVRGASDVNVLKLDPTGTQQLANILIGGSDNDTPKDIAVDAAGNVYVTGSTASTDFPVGWPGVPAGVGGGLCFKSTDGGASWNPSGRGMATASSSERLLIDPHQPSTLYLDTYITSTGIVIGDALHKSVDSGENWISLSKNLGDGPRQALLALVPSNPATIYVGTYDSLRKSTDGGVTWSAAGLNVTGLILLAFTPRDLTSLYATTDSAVYKSADGGRTWRQASAPPEVLLRKLVVDPNDANTLFLIGAERGAGTGTRIFKSTDGAATWNLLTTTFANRNALTLVFDPAGSTLYAGTTRGLFKSHDSGRNWEATGLNNLQVDALAIDPLLPSRLYAATSYEAIESGERIRTVGGVQRSLDGGLNWSSFDTRLKGRVVQDLALNPQNPATLYASTRGYPEAFVLKLVLKLDNAELAYAVYCGEGAGVAIAADGGGNVYLAGQSNGPEVRLPVAKIGLGLPEKGETAFVAKLDAQGRSFLFFSTFGSGAPSDLAVDGTGKIYVAGTSRGGLAIKNGLPSSMPSVPTPDVFDAFVSKFDPEQSGASALLYSTYLGGQGADYGNGIAALADGKVYITGYVSQPSGLATFPFTTKLSQEMGNIFLAKLDTTKTGTEALLWSAMLGTGYGHKVVADAAGNAYVAGAAKPAFPTTPGALQTDFAGGNCSPITCSCPLVFGFCPFRCQFGNIPQRCTDAFVAKVHPDGAALSYSTFLGSGTNIDEEAHGIALDAADNVYLSGVGSLPTTAGAFNNSAFNGFISKLTLGTRSAAMTTLSAADYRGPELARGSLSVGFLEAAGEWARALTVRVKDSTGTEQGAVTLYSGDGQVNFLIPPLAATGMARVQVLSGNVAIAAGAIRIVEVAPGIFTADASGRGLPAAVALRVKPDGTASYEPILRFDATLNRFVPIPIDFGPEAGNASDQMLLVLFGTGWRNRSAESNVKVTAGGAAAPVLYAGLQPTLIGLDQINARLPRSLAGRGEVDVVVTVDGKTSNTVRITIK